ncbi:T9SS-dependent M36 family metallopeptidase [Soonwooa sp.]|uniref:T9SS-dependent M36 family metallopeptidase n=1 Tax=Soonwooa sp. TaxID=1938592 RepID=UPI0026111081|nr:T9SS-dependent M36 family metallopeptidase [Soonwooa sp.]
MKNSLLKRSVGVGALFFMTVMNGQSTETIIRDFISNDVSFRGVSKAVEFKILNEDSSESLKANVVDVQQTVNGIPVYHSLAKAVIKDGKMWSFNNNFDRVQNVSKYAKPNSVASAFSAAVNNLGLNESNYTLVADGVSVDNPKAEQVANFAYYYQKDGKLVPARLFFIDDSKNHAVWQVMVNLENNEILEKYNTTLSCNFHDGAYSEVEGNSVAHNHVHSLPAYVENQLAQANKAASAAVISASYNVFPFPTEAPTFGPRAVLTDPWDITASPLGWQDNGTSSFTYTRGNNVHAYFDNAATNTPPTTDRTDGGPSYNFNFPYAEGPNISAYDNKHSAITNLFYANNMIHDVFYRFGFTESSKNFQTNNFDKGGRGNDAVNAEGFDGSGYNNANFNAGYETETTVAAPRMQMFLWKSGEMGIKQKLFYNSPADAVNRPPVAAGGAVSGKQLFSIPVTGDVVIPNVANGCSTLTAGSLNGKIALLNWAPGGAGECTPLAKVKNAQAAGAKGAIIHRTNSNTPIDVAGTDQTVVIPSIMIGLDEGNYILSQINAGTTVNVDLKDMGFGYKNSSFDNGVMIHEYGHGISNRLTGNSMGCLNNAEQMGEGWSDFFALMLTNKPSYTAATARGIATYSNGQDPSAVGIRPRKYSPDFAINDYTYGRTNGMQYNDGGVIRVDVHSVGFVWATMLWDLHWKLAEKYGYASDIVANPNSGSAKVVQLVVDGLKLQPCSPDFVSGRDAIIAADLAKGGDNECLIWNVFARRGLGVNASAGSNNSINDQVENFDLPEQCKLATSDVNKTKAFNVYPNPAKGEFFIAGKPTLSQGSVKVDIYDISGKVVKSFERKKNSVDAVSTANMAKGIYLVNISENGNIIQTDKLIVE